MFSLKENVDYKAQLPRVQLSAGLHSFVFYGSTVWNSVLPALHEKSNVNERVNEHVHEHVHALKIHLFDYDVADKHVPPRSAFCISAPKI